MITDYEKLQCLVGIMRERKEAKMLSKARLIYLKECEHELLEQCVEHQTTKIEKEIKS